MYCSGLYGGNITRNAGPQLLPILPFVTRNAPGVAPGKPVKKFKKIISWIFRFSFDAGPISLSFKVGFLAPVLLISIGVTHHNGGVA